MKSVLISIHPKWCELIAAGKKTVEIRKTRPNLETPFKVYIYCTQPKRWFRYSSFGRASDESLWLSGGKVEMCDGFKYWCNDGDYTNLNGKVIGEFVCDAFVVDKTFGHNPLFWATACMDEAEVAAYCTNPEMCGWHISNLKIYDNPKPLSDFSTVDKHAVKQCEHRTRACNNPDLTNGAFLPGSYVCMKGEIDWCSACKRKPIIRPPQSWCYVEELDNA